MDSLKRIYHTKSGITGWYKEGRREGARCPPDDPTISVRESYRKTFRCLPSEQFATRDIKSVAAKTCASERMANMKYSHVSKGRSADKGHLHPIKMAYGLGKQCLQVQGVPPGSAEHYKRTFRTWYDELIKGSNQTHMLFQDNIGTTERYPLEVYDPNTNNKTRSATTDAGKANTPTQTTPKTPINKMNSSSAMSLTTDKKTKTNRKSKTPPKKTTTRRQKRSAPKPLFVSNNM